eukprot:1195292-Prorocentrum_minimum.AAC.7
MLSFGNTTGPWQVGKRGGGKAVRQASILARATRVAPPERDNSLAAATTARAEAEAEPVPDRPTPAGASLEPHLEPHL